MQRRPLHISTSYEDNVFIIHSVHVQPIHDKFLQLDNISVMATTLSAQTALQAVYTYNTYSTGHSLQASYYTNTNYVYVRNGYCLLSSSDQSNCLFICLFVCLSPPTSTGLCLWVWILCIFPSGPSDDKARTGDAG